jgi:hypothetical protein
VASPVPTVNPAATAAPADKEERALEVPPVATAVPAEPVPEAIPAIRATVETVPTVLPAVPALPALLEPLVLPVATDSLAALAPLVFPVPTATVDVPETTADRAAPEPPETLVHLDPAITALQPVWPLAISRSTDRSILAISVHLLLSIATRNEHTTGS